MGSGRGLRETRAGRWARDVRHRPPRLPRTHAPDPAAALAFPDDTSLPAEVHDAAILDRLLRQPRPTATLARPPRLPLRRPVRNVLLLSHCDFNGNSALHVFSLARELQHLGLSPAIEVPAHPEGAAELGEPTFPIVGYGAAFAFPDGEGPDVVHAFSPRELVRNRVAALVREHGVPYVVHLEDDDRAILAAELGGVAPEALRRLPPALLDRVVRIDRVHPVRGRRFLEQAAAATVITPRLLELLPPHLPAVAFNAGFDPSVLSPRRSRSEVRAELRIAPDDIVLVYPGSVHATNVADMRMLYRAVATLRSEGRTVVLVKTGVDAPCAWRLPRLGSALRDLGRVPRNRIPELLAAADILVQPGRAGTFDDYRFPSKVPEFLASGRPVVLPRTNVGLELRQDVDAVVLDRGDAAEIAAAVARLADDPDLRARIGSNGHAFALRTLRWSSSAAHVARLYERLGIEGAPPAADLDRMDSPVRLVALTGESPPPDFSDAVRRHGITVDSTAGRQLPDTGEPYGPMLEAALRDDASSSVVPAALREADDWLYAAWLRKRTLQALIRDDPTVEVDVSPVLRSSTRWRQWLTTTAAAVEAGSRQYYASCGAKAPSREAV